MDRYNPMDRGTLVDRLYRHRTSLERILFCLIACLLATCFILVMAMLLAWSENYPETLGPLGKDNQDTLGHLGLDRHDPGNHAPSLQDTEEFKASTPPYRRARIEILDPVSAQPLSDDIIDWK